jgi:hypothetical protein
MQKDYRHRFLLPEPYYRSLPGAGTKTPPSIFRNAEVSADMEKVERTDRSGDCDEVERIPPSKKNRNVADSRVLELASGNAAKRIVQRPTGHGNSSTKCSRREFSNRKILLRKYPEGIGDAVEESK